MRSQVKLQRFFISATVFQELSFLIVISLPKEKIIIYQALHQVQQKEKVGGLSSLVS